MDIKTDAIVLRRTNYGEANRIIAFLTPEGKFSAMARGVRREKSKLAGAIELFSVSRITLHQGRSDLYALTSARLDTFYSNILMDYAALEFAYEVLAAVNRKSEQIVNPEFFSLTREVFAGLHSAGFAPLIPAWWHLNLLRATGEPINLSTDTSGNRLSPDKSYLWDPADQAFRESSAGPNSTNLIKLLRLLVTSPLSTALKVTDIDPLLPFIANITKSLPL